MEILNIRVLKGPNYWSNFRKNLIEMKVDLQEFEEKPTNLLDGFTDSLMRLMPSLHSHTCSYGYEDGFLLRLREGTWLGHVVEHIALELQCLAGMYCAYGRTRQRGSQPGVYYVVFSFEIESAGLFAAEAAVRLVKSLIQTGDYPQFKEDVEHLKAIHTKESFGISTKAIIKEAEKRDIPYTRLDDKSLMLLGQGYKQKLICATISPNTSTIGVDIAADKALTKKILASALIPVPKGLVIQTREELNHAIMKLGFPVVLKPTDGNHGRGITTNVTSKAKAISAFETARKISSEVLIERFYEGDDYRFLMINYKLVAVAKRVPAAVTGDGYSSIQELIKIINLGPGRGVGHEDYLTKIVVDDLTISRLKDDNLSLDTILPKGKVAYLKYTSNLSSGGHAKDVTDTVHPHNIVMAERIARLLNLDVCGIDVVARTIEEPLPENGAVVEVNASPGLRMHLIPFQGTSRNVAKPIIDMLYPHNASARIPVVAVTGTNGKTTTVRLLAHMAKQAGFIVGHTTTEGIYINNELVYEGDCSGPASAKSVLRDPMIDFAVLECARGGILRSGLGFDQCDISILLNITEDHLGLDDIDTMGELARLKSVVVHSTAKSGHAILNADDDYVYELKDDLVCNIALFSMKADNPRIEAHCREGGLAVCLENNCIVIKEGNTKFAFGNIADIPLTYSGTATAMIQNVLASVLAGVVCHFKKEEIFSWLKNFQPSASNTPGRMNLFSLNQCQILVDYAHNKAAYLELENYLSHVSCNKKIGIIGSPGDRRPEDIHSIGSHAAALFDEIIIRLDKDNRGKSADEVAQYLLAGIYEVNKTMTVCVIDDEMEALDYALKKSEKGSFIVICPEDIFTVINFLQKQEKQLFSSKELSYEA